MMAYRAALALALVFAVTMLVKGHDEYRPAFPPRDRPRDRPGPGPGPGLSCGDNEKIGCAECQDIPCSKVLYPLPTDCSSRCRESCVCREGYYRQNRRCVHASECRVDCPRRMFYDHNAPEPETCERRRRPGGRRERKPRCVCKGDLVLEHSGSDNCIERSRCRRHNH